jgi:hypothetical protein
VRLFNAFRVAKTNQQTKIISTGDACRLETRRTFFFNDSTGKEDVLTGKLGFDALGLIDFGKLNAFINRFNLADRENINKKTMIQRRRNFGES